MGTRIVMLGLVFIMTLLVGVRVCSGPAKKREAVVSAPPAQTAPPPHHPASPGQYRVSEKGIGPIQLGMKLADAEAALGEPFRLIGTYSDCGYVDWLGAPPGVAIVAEDGRVRRIDVAGAGVMTDFGIAIGEDSARLAAVYGAMGRTLEKSVVRMGAIDVALTSDIGASFQFDYTDRIGSYQVGYMSLLNRQAPCT